MTEKLSWKGLFSFSLQKHNFLKFERNNNARFNLRQFARYAQCASINAKTQRTDLNLQFLIFYSQLTLERENDRFLCPQGSRGVTLHPHYVQNKA